MKRNSNEDIRRNIKLKLLYLTKKKNRDRKDWVDICAMSCVCVTSRPFASWLILTICLDLDGWQLSAERLGWKTHHSEQTADQTVSSVLSRSAIGSVSLSLSFLPSLSSSHMAHPLFVNQQLIWPAPNRTENQGSATVQQVFNEPRWRQEWEPVKPIKHSDD